MSMLYLKGSFEDEGLNTFEVQILSALAAQLGIPLAFKIGGCEAKSDILTALNYGAHCIVAPMIESEFAAKKFITATEPFLSLFKERNINIETITAVENAEDIIRAHCDKIDGIVVGRTDLALSMGLSKKDVDSERVMEKVESVLRIAKTYNMKTTMGGSVNINSITCIVDMHSKGLLDRFETRKVIIEASKNIGKLESDLKEAFHHENVYLDRTLFNYDKGILSARARIASINQRGR